MNTIIGSQQKLVHQNIMKLFFGKTKITKNVVFGKKEKSFFVRKKIFFFLLLSLSKQHTCWQERKIFFVWKPIFAIQFSFLFSFSFLQKKTINLLEGRQMVNKWKKSKRSLKRKVLKMNLKRVFFRNFANKIQKLSIQLFLSSNHKFKYRFSTDSKIAAQQFSLTRFNFLRTWRVLQSIDISCWYVYFKT